MWTSYQNVQFGLNCKIVDLRLKGSITSQFSCENGAKESYRLLQLPSYIINVQVDDINSYL